MPDTVNTGGATVGAAPATVARHETREGWLRAAVAALRPTFLGAAAPVPPLERNA